VSGRTFLAARWSYLALVTYEVDPALVRAYAHPACEPESRDGRALVSLVGFLFEDCRVLGIHWPGYTRFPEVNLRFYVRHRQERGVGFVRELVPQRLVAFLARTLYNEPYADVPGLSGVVTEEDAAVRVRYAIPDSGRIHRLEVRAEPHASVPPEESLEQALKEQRWGFGRGRRGELIRYEVRHPPWEVFPVRDVVLDVDYGRLYGPDWACLDRERPLSVILARGSAVEVSPPRFERPATQRQSE
jgi:uncharacterized protein YqjF (DUF2071 family)